MALRVSLPGGAWRDGRRESTVLLEPPAPDAEAALLDAVAHGTPAERATTLLACCVARLGERDRPAPDDVRALTAGDREALLLHLRRMIVGERLEALVDCPRPECEARLEVAPEVGDLLLAPYDEAPEWHERTFELARGATRVRFRLPTGHEQELAGRLGRDQPDRAVRLVAERCVARLEDARSGRALAGLPDDALDPLSAAMAEADPQAELLLELTCPDCGCEFIAPLDAGGFLLVELDRRARRLDWEIHVLAVNYHWSERDILGLGTRKRQRYLALLQEEPEESA